MAYFKRSNTFGEKGGKKFGGGRGFGDRDGARPAMHKANCAECGNECEVPFKPMGGRPVYCNNCFKTKGDSAPGRLDSRSFNKPHFADKPMFTAVCATCGSRCEVPFRPMDGKPVYCKQCFHKGDNGPMPIKNNDNYKEQFTALNAKLDKILQLLAVGMASNGPDQKSVEKKSEVVKVKKATKKPTKKKK